MPTFRPPLAHKSIVTVPLGSASSYVHLTFVATFEPDEDQQGAWQIWTNLPNCAGNDIPTGPAGEWHAHTFQVVPVQSSDEVPNDRLKGEEGASIIKIPPSLSRDEADPSRPHSLLAHVVVPANTGIEYAYTFRHVTSSGETRWLGSGGSNGIVSLQEGSTSFLEDERSGPWAEESADIRPFEWKSVAIELEDKDGILNPNLIDLPSPSPVAAAMILATRSAQTVPSFASMSTSASSLPGADDLHLVVVSTTPFTVPTGSTLPEACSHANFRLSRSLSTALSKIGKEASQSCFAPLSTDVDDVLALGLRAQLKHNSEALQAIILAAPAFHHNQVSVDLPAEIDNATPLLVQVGGGKATCLEGSQKGRQLLLHLPRGTFTALLRITSFKQLALKGAEPLWVCSPMALQTETITASLESSNEAAVDDKSHDKDDDSVQGRKERDNVSAPEFEEENNEGDDAPFVGEVGQGWWLWRVLGSFCLDFWHSILAPFRRPTWSETTDDATSEGSAETPDQDSDVPTTPPDEHSSLLGSTASPTYVYSATSSPPSFSPTKLGNNLNSLVKQLHDPTTSLSARAKPYARFTFARPPPFRLYMRSETDHATDRLKFSLKAGDNNFHETIPTLTRLSAGFLELTISGNSHEVVDRWQVQLE